MESVVEQSEALIVDDMKPHVDAVIGGLKRDPEWAWSYHCAIAMAIVDEGVDHATANHAAARFMRLFAGVEPAHKIPPKQQASVTESRNHKLDTDTHVFFYEQDFYVLSNFSAFRIFWNGRYFDTSEAAYHCEKFPSSKAAEVRHQIMDAASAHEAFKIAERNKALRRPDWDAVKVDVMREILRAKADQHEYVRRKLLATGDRILVEDSWRDPFWGWGPQRDGKNVLGNLWMEIRAELRKAVTGEQA